MEQILSKEKSFRMCVSKNPKDKGCSSIENKEILNGNDSDANSGALEEEKRNPSPRVKTLLDLSHSVQSNLALEPSPPIDDIISGTAKCYETISDSTSTVKLKVYRIRYLMLLIFSLCSFINGFMWIRYAIITNIVSCYYNVSATAVNWTSLIYMVIYLPLTLPTAWFMHVKGLRITLIVGSALNCLCSYVQCLSLAPNRFFVVILGQIIAAVAQTFTLSVPPFLAAVWFGPEEVSLACAFGVFGNQLGIALGFLLPPLIVSHDCMVKDHITHGLMYLAFGLTAVNSLLFIAVLVAFKDKPKQPPSHSEALKWDKGTINFKATFSLLKNPQYLILWANYGIFVSVYYAVSTLLNQMVLEHFPGREIEAGWMGLIGVFAGMIGSLIFGCVLSKTHKFREISISINIMGFLAVVAYTGLIYLQLIWIQFVMIAIIGFFIIAFISVGFEYGSEMTYPLPEGNSASLLNASAQAFGITVSAVGSWLLQTYGDLALNLFFCLCTFVSFVLCASLKAKLLRRMYEDSKCKEDA